MEIKSFVGSNVNSEEGNIVYKNGKTAEDLKKELINDSTIIFCDEKNFSKEVILEIAKKHLSIQELKQNGSIISIGYLSDYVLNFGDFYRIRKDRNIINKLSYELALYNYKLKGFDISKDNKYAVNREGNFYDISALEEILSEKTIKSFKSILGEEAGQGTVDKINKKYSTKYSYNDFVVIYNNLELYKKYIEALYYLVNQLDEKKYRPFIIKYPPELYKKTMEEIYKTILPEHNVMLRDYMFKSLVSIVNTANGVFPRGLDAYFRTFLGLDIEEFTEDESKLGMGLEKARFHIEFIDMILKSLTKKTVLFAPINYLNVNIPSLDISEEEYIDLIDNKRIRPEVFEKAKEKQEALKNRIKDVLGGINIEYIN